MTEEDKDGDELYYEDDIKLQGIKNEGNQCFFISVFQNIRHCHV
jgi:ubiquitin C-terminal hydrolase